MPKAAVPVTVAAYIAAQPKAMQAALKRVRSTLRAALPEAEECMSYQMPTYKLKGRVVIHFAGWKDHFALYPGAGHVVATLKDALKGYDVSKGTIRFAATDPVPVRLITQIAKARGTDVAAKVKAKPKAAAKRKAKRPRK